MRDQLRKALDFAIAKEREAEAFYKEWAAKIGDPVVHALFAELAAAEHGHKEMLAHVTPEDLVRRASASSEVRDLHLSDHLVDVPADADLTLQEAMILAMKREGISVALYERLAQLGGDTVSLFTALAAEERRHKLDLETQYDEQFLTEN